MSDAPPIDAALAVLRDIRDSRCDRCAADMTAPGPGQKSSYRERLCAPIAERLGEFGFIYKQPFEIIVRPAEGYTVELVIEGVSRRLRAPEARTIANGLNSLADIIDQLNNHWTGKGHPAIGRPE